MVGVVVGENRVQIQARGLQFGQTLVVGIAACCIRRAVGAIAADGEDRRTGNTGDAFAGRERQLLVPSAEAFSGEVNDGLAAGDEGEGPAVSGVAFENFEVN